MSPWLQLLLSLVWIASGLLLGRRSGRTGNGLVWAVVLGPLGVLLFGYGEWRRSAPSPAPLPVAATADLDLPVQVLVDGHWREGRLQTWAQGEAAWHGWVRYSTDGVEGAAWFTDGEVRRPPGASGQR